MARRLPTWCYVEVMVEGKPTPRRLGRYPREEAIEEAEAWFENPEMLARHVGLSETNYLVAVRVTSTRGHVIRTFNFEYPWNEVEEIEEEPYYYAIFDFTGERPHYRPRGGALLAERKCYEEPIDPVDLLLEYNIRLLERVKTPEAEKLLTAVSEMATGHNPRLLLAG